MTPIYMENKSITNHSDLENILENNSESQEKNMTFGGVFKSMIPSIVVGTLAAAGCQELCSEYTSNPELITSAGLAGQFIGGWATYLPAHYLNNKDKLKDENGKVKWKQYAQDIGSIIASDQIGNKVWASSYAIANEISLRSGLDPGIAGTISGGSSMLIYSAFTAYAAPKVSSIINYAKGKLQKK